jgi:PLD-like domain
MLSARYRLWPDRWGLSRVAGFDISSLTEFHPPISRCWLCLALWSSEITRLSNFRCPGCNSVYASRITYTAGVNLTTWTGSVGGEDSLPPGVSATPANLWSPTYGLMQIDFSLGRQISIGSEPMAHATELAKLAVELRDSSRDNPPLRVLMKLLLASQSFIHIMSFNFDEFTLALLEMAAQRTSIAATFSGVDPRRQGVLEQVAVEAPALEYRVEGTKADIGDQNHGKLIVIDGLLAVIGSPNLTRPAWRKAAANMEIVEVVSDISRVAELNNRYFSPLWKRLQPDARTRYHVSTWDIITPEDSAHPDREDHASEGNQEA